jgi:hypothetical protein
MMFADIKFWVKPRGKSSLVLVDVNEYKHDLSVVFFKPSVLDRYLASPSKYSMRDDHIRCKEDGWILQSCYTSSNNEVYSYLCDLRLLPQDEIKYWYLHNLAEPTGALNFLAESRDFDCSFENFAKEKLYIVLKRLAAIDLQFNQKAMPLWEPKKYKKYADALEKMVDDLFLPLTNEDKQFCNNFLLPLACLVVEGFSSECLKKWAEALGVTLDPSWGTLKILEECLNYICNDVVGTRVVVSLKELQKEKSARASHGGKVPEEEPIAKAKDMLDKITFSLEEIAIIIEQYYENVSLK